MPKNRRRNTQKGAKSISIRTKHKIGGRKSNKGVKQMSVSEMNEIFERCRPRDRFKLVREARNRLVLRCVAPG
jgi:hypothetical protein